MTRLVLGAMLVLGVIAVLVLLGRQLGAQVPLLVASLDSFGIWGPIVFVLAYALATVAFVPGIVLTVAAGALFGLVGGTVYVFLGAVLGSSAAFFIARYLARDAVERRVQGIPRFAAIDRAVGEQGRRIVLLLRLSPVFPYNLLNYALGLTRVRFRDYLLASVGMLPGTILYVYSGKLVGDVAAVAAGMGAPRGTVHYALLALGLAATVAVTVVITRLARNALREETVL